MNERTRHRIRAGVTAAAIAAALWAPALGFQSRGTVQCTAVAVTAGIRPQFLKISHTPLTQGSPITQEVIIVGEAGFDTPTVSPSFNQRLTSAANLPAGSRQIRVWIE